MGLLEPFRAYPFVLAAGAVAEFECDADRLYLNVGPVSVSQLFVRLDDTGPEMTITQGHYSRTTRFRRIRLRNGAASAIAGTLLLSADPAFAVIHPGAGGSPDAWVFSGDRIIHRHHTFAAIPTVTFSTAGSTSTLRNPILEVNTGATILANKVRGNAENEAGVPWSSDATRDFWGYRHRVRARGQRTVALSPTDDDSQFGILLGNIAAYPFVGGGNNNIRLYGALASNTWKLAVRNTIGLTITPLTGIPVGPMDGFGATLEFDYVPGSYVKAFVNEVLGATLTAAAQLPNIAQATDAGRMAGVYVGCSADANDQVAAGFLDLDAWTYL